MSYEEADEDYRAEEAREAKRYYFQEAIDYEEKEALTKEISLSEDDPDYDEKLFEAWLEKNNDDIDWKEVFNPSLDPRNEYPR